MKHVDGSPKLNPLWQSIEREVAAATGIFHAPGACVRFADIASGSTLGGASSALRGCSVLIAADRQLAAAIAMIELDGTARRIVLCTPDLTADQLAAVANAAEADAVVSDRDVSPLPAVPHHRLAPHPAPGESFRGTERTEWILLTSGTTGAPKLVRHTLDSLAGTLPEAAGAVPAVWSTFYDIRRYGGLQIYLRAVRGGSPLVLSDARESTGDFLARAASAGVTHISGTPSHWRRALMSGAAGLIKPVYVRLSGEVADQALLDHLRAAYPKARIAHAFASTEAGVAFDVDDGQAGFPAAFVGKDLGGVELKVEDGTLRIRSRRNASRYLGDAPGSLAGSDGYVDTGDLVELRDGRFHFRGRRGGVINVGGLKVHPEEVEAVLNADPRVRMSLVRARRSPITGAVVVADIVPADPANAAPGAPAAETLKMDLLEACRRALPAHKVPTTLRFVAALDVTAAGKLVRPGA